MDYRSDVTVVIYGNGCNAAKYEALKVLMTTTFASVDKEWGGHAEWNNLNKMLIFRIENVKWYEGYTEVQDFLSMLSTLAEELGYNYELARLGDSTEDVVTDRDGEDIDYILQVERTVAINF